MFFQGHLTDSLRLLSFRTNLARNALAAAPSPGRESCPQDTAGLGAPAQTAPCPSRRGVPDRTVLYVIPSGDPELDVLPPGWFVSALGLSQASQHSTESSSFVGSKAWCVI